MANPLPEPTGSGPLIGRNSIFVRRWDRPVMLTAVVAIIVLGMIAGLRALIALFP